MANEEKIYKSDSKFLLDILKYGIQMIQFTMKYRTRTDIIVRMLESARDGATKTKIMYSSYLSSSQLTTYLELVISNGLLAHDSKEKLYRTTEKGLRLLELHNSVGELELAPTAWTLTQK